MQGNYWSRRPCRQRGRDCQKARSNTKLFKGLEELHGVGENLVPLYLILHVGGVLLYTILETHAWRRMFTFGKTPDNYQPKPYQPQDIPALEPLSD